MSGVTTSRNHLSSTPNQLELTNVPQASSSPGANSGDSGLGDSRASTPEVEDQAKNLVGSSVADVDKGDEALDMHVAHEPARPLPPLWLSAEDIIAKYGVPPPPESELLTEQDLLYMTNKHQFEFEPQSKIGPPIEEAGASASAQNPGGSGPQPRWSEEAHHDFVKRNFRNQVLESPVPEHVGCLQAANSGRRRVIRMPPLNDPQQGYDFTDVCLRCRVERQLRACGINPDSGPYAIKKS